MRIRIVQRVPVGNEHGTTVGRIFEVARRDGGLWFVMGDAGEEVGLWNHEREPIDDESEPDADPATA